MTSLELLERLRSEGTIEGQAERILLEVAESAGRIDWLDRAEGWIAKLPDPLRLQLELDSLDQRSRMGILSEARMDQIMSAATRDGEALRAVANWMLASRLDSLLLDWVETWEAPLLNDPRNAQIAIRVLDRKEAYAKVYSLLRDQVWPDKEYMRYAFLAHAEDHLMADNRTVANPWWDRAIQHAAEWPNRFPNLALQFQQWEQWDMLERLLSKASDPVRKSPAFDRFEFTVLEKQGKTQELLARFEEKLEQFPENPVLKNNVAALGILVNPEHPQYHELAGTNFEQFPGNPDVAATWASSRVDVEPARVRQTLEPLLKRFPTHPGLIFYFGEAHRVEGLENPMLPFCEELIASERLFPEELQRLQEWKGTLVSAR